MTTTCMGPRPLAWNSAQGGAARLKVKSIGTHSAADASRM